MAPYATEITGVLNESDAVTSDLGIAHRPVQKADDIKWRYKWHIIILFAFLHGAGLYGAYLIFASAKWQTVIFAVLMEVAGVLGITAGAHRLWAHKAYKAKWPLRIILVILQTISGQYSAIDWVRTHRTHHKYSETDADPHNATRGFFFSHIGCIIVYEHPECLRKRDEVDLSDLYRDPILRFQKKYYWILVTLFSAIIPAAIPAYFWNEPLIDSFFCVTAFRYIVNLHVVCCINSVAHMLGPRPYDAAIRPSETFICSMLCLGEGYHNYHHAFPWDYKASELFETLNTTTHFIDMFAKIGWAYDMKTVSEEIIQKRVKRTGDGSHHLWGWGDKDLSEEEKNAAIIINSKNK